MQMEKTEPLEAESLKSCGDNYNWKINPSKDLEKRVPPLFTTIEILYLASKNHCIMHAKENESNM